MLTRRSRTAESIMRGLQHVRGWAATQMERWKPQVSPSSRDLTGVVEQAAIRDLHAQEPHCRWEAAAILGKNPLRGPEAIASLIEAFTDPEPFVRWQASEALAAQESGRVFPALCDGLSSEDPLKRAGAAEALGRLGGEAACVRLREALRDREPSVRAAAASALGKSTDLTAVRALLPLLDDSDADVRRAAAGALGTIGDTAASAPLARALVQTGQSLLVRRALASALAKTPHPEAQPLLVDALSDPDPQVRGYVAQALGQVGNETAWTALVAMQGDNSALLHGTVGDAARQAITLLERRGRQANPAHVLGADR